MTSSIRPLFLRACSFLSSDEVLRWLRLTGCAVGIGVAVALAVVAGLTAWMRGSCCPWSAEGALKGFSWST
jgi:hypothetical protein